MNKADLSGIISSPKKPNIMQFLFTLTEEVDCGIIYDAMQKTIKRYPYFAFRIVKAEKGYDKIENPLPIKDADIRTAKAFAWVINERGKHEAFHTGA